MVYLAVTLFLIFDQSLDYDDLSRKMALTRKNITSCQLEIIIENSTLDKPLKTDLKASFWIDKSKMRIDYSSVSAAGVEEPRSFICQNCWRTNSLLSGSVVKNRSAKIIPLTEKKIRDKFGDPRKIGYFAEPFGLNYINDFSFFFETSDIKGKKVEKVEFEGSDCLMVEGVEPSGLKIKRIISPKFGYNVVFLEANIFKNGKAINSFQKSNFSEKPIDNVWFPEKTELKTYIDNELLRAENIYIKSFSFNRPIDAKIFNIDSLGIPEGNLVVDETGSDGKTKFLLVSGSKIGPYTPVDILPVPETPTIKKNSNFLIYLSLIGLFFIFGIGLYLISNYFKNQFRIISK